MHRNMKRRRRRGRSHDKPALSESGSQMRFLVTNTAPCDADDHKTTFLEWWWKLAFLVRSIDDDKMHRKKIDPGYKAQREYWRRRTRAQLPASHASTALSPFSIISHTHTYPLHCFTHVIKHKRLIDYYIVYFCIILNPTHNFIACPNLTSFPPKVLNNR